MAAKIYNYCNNFPAISAISGNKEALRRFVKVKALEFCIDNAENIENCLDEETINKVMEMIKG